MLLMVDVNEDVNTFKNIENISAPLAVSCNIDVMNSMKLRRFKCLNVHTWVYVCTCVCMCACVYAYMCVYSVEEGFFLLETCSCLHGAIKSL